MLKIGITGGIGSGKTIICKVFETIGIPVFYADVIAREIMVNDPLLIEGVKQAFGVESYREDGVLNNKYIAQIVFNNAAELAKLNALVHPAVFRAFDLWLTKVPVKAPYILKEAALLFESESYKMCDKSILVIAPLTTKLERISLRDGLDKEQIKARMDKQFTDDQKKKMADFIICNDETQSVILQVLALHQQFLNDIR